MLGADAGTAAAPADAAAGWSATRAGVTRFARAVHGIAQELDVFVAPTIR